MASVPDEVFKAALDQLTPKDFRRAFRLLNEGWKHDFQPPKTRYIPDTDGNRHAFRAVLNAAMFPFLKRKLNPNEFGPIREGWCFTKLRELGIRVVQNVNFEPPTEEEVEDTYQIEDMRKEVNVREKQSWFHKQVATNFEGKCCLSGIREDALLIASHIVPWADDKTIRLDPSNGLLLDTLHDRLFDRGFISFTDDLKVIVRPPWKECSDPLRQLLKSLKGRQARHPIRKGINPAYLCYHRKHRFNKKP